MCHMLNNYTCFVILFKSISYLKYKMPEFVVDFRLLDALIYSAVALAIYLVYTYFNSKPAHVPKPVMDKMPVETDAVNKLVNSAPVNNTANKRSLLICE